MKNDTQVYLMIASSRKVGRHAPPPAHKHTLIYTPGQTGREKTETNTRKKILPAS